MSLFSLSGQKLVLEFGAIPVFTLELKDELIDESTDE